MRIHHWQANLVQLEPIMKEIPGICHRMHGWLTSLRLWFFSPLFIFRYFYPFPVPPLLYQVELSVGGQQFNGKGKTRQAAKHDAAAKALRILQNEPPPERLEVRREQSWSPWHGGQSRRVACERRHLKSLFLRRCTESCPEFLLFDSLQGFIPVAFLSFFSLFKKTS